MEGLIPFLINAMQKQRLPEGSCRGYLLVAGGDSFNGSSHNGRTRSDYQPPSALELPEQPSGDLQFLRSSSFRRGSVNSPSMVAGGANYGAYNNSHQMPQGVNYISNTRLMA